MGKKDKEELVYERIIEILEFCNEKEISIDLFLHSISTIINNMALKQRDPEAALTEFLKNMVIGFAVQKKYYEEECDRAYQQSDTRPHNTPTKDKPNAASSRKKKCSSKDD